MRTIEIITFPQVQPGVEFTVDLPAQAQILKFVLRFETRAIQTVDGIRATVNPAVRVLVDRSQMDVPRRFVSGIGLVVSLRYSVAGWCVRLFANHVPYGLNKDFRYELTSFPGCNTPRFGDSSNRGTPSFSGAGRDRRS